MDAADWWSTLQDRATQAKDFAAHTVDEVKNSEFGKKASEAAGQVGELASKKFEEIKEVDWSQKVSDLQAQAEGTWKKVTDSETVKSMHSRVTGLIGSEENSDGDALKAVGRPITTPPNPEQSPLKSKAIQLIHKGTNVVLDGVSETLDLAFHIGKASKAVAQDALYALTNTSQNLFRTTNALTGAVAATAEAVEKTTQFANEHDLFSWVATAWAVEQVAKAAFWVAAAGGVAIGGGGYTIGRTITQYALPQIA